MLIYSKQRILFHYLEALITHQEPYSMSSIISSISSCSSWIIPNVLFVMLFLSSISTSSPSSKSSYSKSFKTLLIHCFHSYPHIYHQDYFFIIKMSINSDAALFSYCTMHKFIFVREVYKRQKFLLQFQF